MLNGRPSNEVKGVEVVKIIWPNDIFDGLRVFGHFVVKVPGQYNPP
jgi:hypothetical protein